MPDTEINTAVSSFVEKIRDIARTRESVKTQDGCPKPPRRRDDHAEAIKRFKDRVECALKGDHAAEEIKEAVWQLLKDLQIDYHK
ncbi:MAG: hypothetical protein ACM3X6_12135 [Patescibacteria group bacterium]